MGNYIFILFNSFYSIKASYYNNERSKEQLSNSHALRKHLMTVVKTQLNKVH